MWIYQRPPHLHFSAGHGTSNTAHCRRPNSITYNRPTRSDGLRSTWPTNITSTRNCLNWLLHTAQETRRAVQHSRSCHPNAARLSSTITKYPLQTQHTPFIQNVPQLETAWSSVITIHLANVLGRGDRATQVAWHPLGGLNIRKGFSLQSVLLRQDLRFSKRCRGRFQSYGMRLCRLT